jgi:hypothetical protein
VLPLQVQPSEHAAAVFPCEIAYAVHASSAVTEVNVFSGLQSKNDCPAPSLCVVWQFAPQQAGVAHSHPSASVPLPELQSEWPAVQVYEHALPLQLAPDAFVVLQTTPQALQLVVVLVGVSQPSVSGGVPALQSPHPDAQM